MNYNINLFMKNKKYDIQAWEKSNCRHCSNYNISEKFCSLYHSKSEPDQTCKSNTCGENK